jgi:hypothetical protein
VTTIAIGLLVLAAALFAGCGSFERQREETSGELQRVFTECAAQQPTGYAAVVRCADRPVRQIYTSKRYAYMDLVELYLAHWVILALKIDAGQLRPEDAQLQLLEHLQRLTAEAQRRDGQYETNGMLLMELRPVLPHRL